MVIIIVQFSSRGLDWRSVINDPFIAYVPLTFQQIKCATNKSYLLFLARFIMSKILWTVYSCITRNIAKLKKI